MCIGSGSLGRCIDAHGQYRPSSRTRASVPPDPTPPRRLPQAGESDRKIEQMLVRGDKYILFPTSLDSADADRVATTSSCLERRYRHDLDFGQHGHPGLHNSRHVSYPVVNIRSGVSRGP